MDNKAGDVRAGWLLRQTRYRTGLDQAGLAARAGVPQSTISVYESGRRQPTLPMLSKLLEAMGAELQLSTVTVPDRLTALTGPHGFRIRRHRQLIVEEATRHYVENVRVLAAEADSTQVPGDHVAVLVDPTPGCTVTGLFSLSTELHEILGVPVTVLTEEQLSRHRRTAEGAVEL